jgi:vitamin B12 transporter
MRSPVFLLLLLLSTAAFADTLKLTVTSPDHQPVPNARVVLHRPDNDQIADTGTTNATGAAEFTLPAGEYRVEVLAASFAKSLSTISVSGETAQSIELHLAGAEQTIEVTSSGTPVETVNSAASVSTVDAGLLKNQQPVAISDTMQFLPGVVLGNTGQTGGLTSMFVRGGESDYNKVIVDGVPVNEVGGFYNFGVTSMESVDRLEFMRGPQSTLYGSDAMSSVVQVFSAEGSTPRPELRLGADGGNFSTANGYGSLAGAVGRFDFNLFADQFNSEGQGPNDAFSRSAQGANIGITLSPKVLLRFRTRHDNSFVGVPGEWVFNGVPLLPPDLTEYAHDNNFLASLALTITPSAHWRHTLNGFEYNHQRYNADLVGTSLCIPFYVDCPFTSNDHQNRAGFNYQGEWTPLTWTRTTFGFDFENETGWVDENYGSPAQIHGLRRNEGIYGEQIVTWKRLTATAGLRFVHDEGFGNKAVPRVALSLLALKGNETFSGTHLRFSYAQGYKEPSFEQSFGVGAYFILPNPSLQPEQSRTYEAGFDQSFFHRYTLSATYFNNLFHDLIEYQTLTPLFFSQYINLNRATAQGAEVNFSTLLRHSIRLDASYTNDSTKILYAPLAVDPTEVAGAPLLRRPKQLGSLLLNYSGKRWGGFVGGSFVGPRPDSDFLYGAVPPINHDPGYALVNLGGWYAITSRVSAYANVNNALDKQYEQVAGYPAMRRNFRAGMRVRLGGE